jgi:hypothetical protein
MTGNKKRLRRENMAKILCPHCEKPVKIRTSGQTTKTIREVRTDCVNESCLARPVYTLSFSHDSQPPLSQLKSPSDYIKTFLDTLCDEEKQKVLDSL